MPSSSTQVNHDFRGNRHAMQTRLKIITAQFTGCSKGQRVLLPDVSHCLTRYTMVKYTKGNTYPARKHKVSAIMRGIIVNSSCTLLEIRERVCVGKMRRIILAKPLLHSHKPRRSKRTLREKVLC